MFDKPLVGDLQGLLDTSQLDYECVSGANACLCTKLQSLGKWPTPVVPALLRQGLADGKLEATMGCIVGPCCERKKAKKEICQLSF